MSAIQAIIGGSSAISFGSLLHFDGANNSTTFSDVALHSWTVPTTGFTSNDAKITTAQSRWGGASGSFDPDNVLACGISAPYSSAFDVGSGDFTIEGWIYPTSVTGSRAVASHGDLGGANWWLIQLNGGIAQFFWSAHSVGTPIIATTTFLPVNTWSFVQFRRTGNTFAVAYNGTQEATGSSTTTLSLSGADLNYGYYRSGGTPVQSDAMIGYLDEWRVSKSSRAFTLPTGPFPDT